MENEITKKELLELTGISYGQLYRWKREKLIPDSWFRKRASFTGQETYLPRDAAIERIQTILRMKDSFSHDEMAAYFNPGMTALKYAKTDLCGLIADDAIDALSNTLGRDAFTYGDLVFALLIEELSAQGIPPAVTAPLAAAWIPLLSEENRVITILEASGQRIPILSQGGIQTGGAARIISEQTTTGLIERLKSRIAPIL